MKATYHKKTQKALCVCINVYTIKHYNTKVTVLDVYYSNFAYYHVFLFLPDPVLLSFSLPKNVPYTHIHTQKFSNIASSVTPVIWSSPDRLHVYQTSLHLKAILRVKPLSKGQPLISSGNNFVKWHTDTENTAKIQPVDIHRIIQVTPLFS